MQHHVASQTSASHVLPNCKQEERFCSWPILSQGPNLPCPTWLHYNVGTTVWDPRIYTWSGHSKIELRPVFGLTSDNRNLTPQGRGIGRRKQ